MCIMQKGNVNKTLPSRSMIGADIRPKRLSLCQQPPEIEQQSVPPNLNYL